MTDTAPLTGRRLRMAGLAFVGLIIVLGVVNALDRTVQVDGPSGSSYVTTSDGSAAFADLLAATGRTVERLRTAVTPDALADVDTFFVIDPGFSGYEQVEVMALRDWVATGGTIVSAGAPARSLVEGLELDVTWVTTTSAETITPSGDSLLGQRFGAFSAFDPAYAQVAGDDNALVLATGIGRGAVVLIADHGLLANVGLAEADHAAFATGLAGDRVMFDEYRHGYRDTDATGLLTALPPTAITTLFFVAFVALVGLFAYGRRLGPPEPAGRIFAPARETYVESLARALRRNGDQQQAASLMADEARRLLADRQGVHDPDRATARLAGLTDEQADAVFQPGPDRLLAIDAAVATLLAPHTGTTDDRNDDEDEEGET